MAPFGGDNFGGEQGGYQYGQAPNPYANYNQKPKTDINKIIFFASIAQSILVVVAGAIGIKNVNEAVQELKAEPVGIDEEPYQVIAFRGDTTNSNRLFALGYLSAWVIVLGVFTAISELGVRKVVDNMPFLKSKLYRGGLHLIVAVYVLGVSGDLGVVAGMLGVLLGLFMMARGKWFPDKDVFVPTDRGLWDQRTKTGAHNDLGIAVAYNTGNSSGARKNTKNSKGSKGSRGNRSKNKGGGAPGGRF